MGHFCRRISGESQEGEMLPEQPFFAFARKTPIEVLKLPVFIIGIKFLYTNMAQIES
jgi:hypothetical protein